jgi:hypothetical protein
MIKSLRSLTRLLGKLDIKYFRYYNDIYLEEIKYRKLHGIHTKIEAEEHHYGWGLKECKDFVCTYLGRETAAATATALRIGIIKGKSDSV